MISSSKNSFNLNLLLAVLFIIAALFSVYMLYALPVELMLPAGFEYVMTKTYITVAVTLVVGGIAIYTAIRNQREIIVYKEKTLEEKRQENEAADDAKKSTISMEGVQDALGQPDRNSQLQEFIRTICRQLEAGQGALYLVSENDGTRKVKLHCGYALSVGESASISYEFGEGLIGQAASEGKTLYVDEVPEGYITIISGLGNSSPRYLLITPVKIEKQMLGVIEIASFTALDENQRRFVDQSTQLLAQKISS